MSDHVSLIDFRNLTRPQALALGIWFVTTLILGTLGYVAYSDEIGHPTTVLTAFYHTGQLFILHAPHFEGHINWMLEMARWSALVFTGRAIFGIGRHLLRREQTTWRMRRLRNHVVVCGLGRRGADCVRFERGTPGKVMRDVVVIDRAPSPDLTEECESLGARVLTGDATDATVLRQAGVAQASVLFALLSDDGANCTVAARARETIAATRRHGEPLLCNVHLSNVELRSTLEETLAISSDARGVTVRFFDLFDLEARRILLESLPFDWNGVRYDEPRRVHLVILGFGRMGRAVAARAAKLGHFANACRDPALRLKISVIDRSARENGERLLSRYPQFNSCCEFELLKYEIDSPAATAQLQAWCADPETMCSVAACFDDEALTSEVAIRLVPRMKTTGTRLALRLARRTGLGLVTELARQHGVPSKWLTPFGMLDSGSLDEAFRIDERERLAEAIHAAYVTAQKGSRPANDPAVQPWRTLMEVFRESNRQQADHIHIKMRAIDRKIVSIDAKGDAVENFDGIAAAGVTELEVLAQMEHNRWNAERWLTGWTYADGPKNTEKRTSPYLIPWSDLSEEIKGYDLKAVGEIPALLAGAGAKACRRTP